MVEKDNNTTRMPVIGKMSDSKKAKMKKMQPLLLLVVIVVVLVSLLAAYNTKQSNKTKLNPKKTTALLKPGNCAKAMPEIKDLQPDPKLPKDSADLLNYRAYCYMHDGEYAKALSEDKLLKEIYIQQNNQSELKDLAIEIEFLEKAVSRNRNTYHAATKEEQVTPAFADKIRNE